MSDDFTIELVPLYTNLDRITKGLAALGLGPTDPIRPEQLFPFDQWHYHGTDAIRTAAERLGIASASQGARYRLWRRRPGALSCTHYRLRCHCT